MGTTPAALAVESSRDMLAEAVKAIAEELISCDPGGTEWGGDN